MNKDLGPAASLSSFFDFLVHNFTVLVWLSLQFNFVLFCWMHTDIEKSWHDIRHKNITNWKYVCNVFKAFSAAYKWQQVHCCGTDIDWQPQDNRPRRRHTESERRLKIFQKKQHITSTVTSGGSSAVLLKHKAEQLLQVASVKESNRCLKCYSFYA